MRLVTYCPPGQVQPCLGALLHAGDDAPVMDLLRAHAWHVSRSGGTTVVFGENATGRALAAGDMAILLAAGADVLADLREIVEAVRRAGETAPRELFLQRSQVGFLPVAHRPGKIVCVGLNFASHIEEARAAGQSMPPKVGEPLGFGKVTTALAGHGAPVVFPRHGGQLDYEVELAMVIGRRCSSVPPEAFADCVAGLTIAIDFSLRDVLFRSGGNPFLAKNFDGFCPLGPALVTLDELGDPDDRMLRLWVNDELRQEESMRNALFSCAQILSYWSDRYTFEPGDVITAGTPAGVGIFSKDPNRWLLKPGDVVRASIDGLGSLTHAIVADARG